MGDLEVMIEEDRLLSHPSPTPSPLLSNPSPTSISEKCWQRAEQTAKKIIRQIQPTVESEVDRLIGKDHLFKQSVILIKSWCCYESLVLDDHHGLISTYALEIMVVYIFHLFHSSLDGPLAALYKFLDYYSKFDWECNCISLHGPISIFSLPDMVAETPDNDGGELLLDKEFIRKCVDMFSVPSRGLDAISQSFPLEHFNIVDPFNEKNNLG